MSRHARLGAPLQSTSVDPESLAFRRGWLNYALSGTASATDYSVPSLSSVTIPAGQASTTVTITPIADVLGKEGPETVTLTLMSGGYTTGSPNVATVTIADSPQTVTVAATDPDAWEVP